MGENIVFLGMTKREQAAIWIDELVQRGKTITDIDRATGIQDTTLRAILGGEGGKIWEAKFEAIRLYHERVMNESSPPQEKSRADSSTKNSGVALAEREPRSYFDMHLAHLVFKSAREFYMSRESKPTWEDLDDATRARIENEFKIYQADIELVKVEFEHQMSKLSAELYKKIVEGGTS